MDALQALQADTVLDGAYRIALVLGNGELGITYEARDLRLDRPVVIKEYFPPALSTRDGQGGIRLLSETSRQAFQVGLRAFLREARTLARFDHPGIVSVLNIFEALGTGYTVMRHEQGRSLKKWLAGLGRPPTQEEMDGIAGPLLDALEVVHGASVLHRDITPVSILIRDDGTPCLIEFGGAKQALREASRSLSGVVKSGYSPMESYAADARSQGPWTDVYGIGATLYEAVTGLRPADATERVLEDRLAPLGAAARDDYRPGFLEALDAALRQRPAERPQSIAELREAMFGEGRGMPSAVNSRPRLRSSASAADRRAPDDGQAAAAPSARPSLGAAPALDLSRGRELTAEGMQQWSAAVAAAEAGSIEEDRSEFAVRPYAPRQAAPAPSMAGRPRINPVSAPPEAQPAAAGRSRRSLAVGIGAALAAAAAGVAVVQCNPPAARFPATSPPPPTPGRRDDRNLALFFARRATERVDMSVFAPPSAAPDTSILVQVFLHKPAQAGRVAIVASMMDAVTALKGTQRLELDLAQDARLDITLSCPGLMVEEPLQTIRWRGEPAFAQFIVGVPRGVRPGDVLATARVSMDGDLIGRITFRLAVKAGVAQSLMQPAGSGGGRYRHAFVSYASEDRRAVLERVQMLQATRTSFFQDLLSLDPGQRWERALYEHIDACDLFLLFWSSAAKRSEWVLREAQYALDRQSRTGEPDIVPVILEGPPPVLPPESLGAIHFDDRIRYFIAAA